MVESLENPLKNILDRILFGNIFSFWIFFWRIIFEEWREWYKYRIQFRRLSLLLKNFFENPTQNILHGPISRKSFEEYPTSDSFWKIFFPFGSFSGEFFSENGQNGIL